MLTRSLNLPCVCSTVLILSLIPSTLFVISVVFLVNSSIGVRSYLERDHAVGVLAFSSLTFLNRMFLPFDATLRGNLKRMNQPFAFTSNLNVYEKRCQPLVALIFFTAFVSSHTLLIN
ncbi:hypothetical protein B4117_1773 [Bacillus mycoides]|nr:hypothetical protein B4117_1773 [Bacillus mycoides]